MHKIKKILSYIKETKAELERVSWPTKKELASNTSVVLNVLFIFTLITWGLDTVLSGLLGLIIK